MSANKAGANAAQEPSQWDLVIERTFDAPREFVFQAWTDPKVVALWWGPTGFTNPVCELDVRVGGEIRIHMRAPDGVVYPMKGVFEEVEKPERLVFLSSALDAHGNSMFDIRNTVTFVEKSGKTLLTLQARVMQSTTLAPQYLKGMEAGWNQTLDKLGKYIGSNYIRGGTSGQLK